MNTYCKGLIIALAMAMMTAWLPLPAVWAAEERKSTAASEDRTVKGTVEKIDAGSRTLTIKGVFKEKTFQVANDATIATTEKSTATLSDLNVGDRVDVTYMDHSGTLVAHRIEQRGSTTKPASKEGPTTPQPMNGEQPKVGEPTAP